ncbi:hypothetical protein ACFQET_09390 [Levilactobacillus tangyuanensis]|uniref:Bacterial Ig domain-containing protein n=1 Tax=Levilactobacillus tangyuanensis TaxID=2486021 RepID=A0ABW1TQ96_9LACO|nr:hypothetical protein [Levilactobacillus tangyuanensis]
MKKVFGYVLGLIAVLSLGGVLATTANAAGNAATATSGHSSVVYSSHVVTSSSSSSSVVSSSSSKKTVKTTKKVVTSAKKMRGRKHYKKNARKILFQKAKKGTKIVLRNRKGQVVKRFTVKKNGKFTIKLTKKQAKKLNKGGKYFTFTVSLKGYKTYTVKYTISK